MPPQADACRAAAAAIREGEDGPSVSVDSGLGEHAGQLGAACDRQRCFPERATPLFPPPPSPSSRNQFIHLFTYRLPSICLRGIPAEHQRLWAHVWTLVVPLPCSASPAKANTLIKRTPITSSENPDNAAMCFMGTKLLIMNLE